MSSIPASGLVAPPPAAQKTAEAAADPTAADGIRATPGSGRLAVKDADGDYRPASTQATTPSSVQAVLTDIKLGG